MNFEEALKKVKAGTATAEERAFVEARMAEAHSALTGEKQLDFDEALSHVQDGTATEEEREYVERQLEDARATLAGGTTPTDDVTDLTAEADAEPASEEGGESELMAESATIDFEAALDHVQQGTATEQEKLYVKSQMAAANAFFSDDFKRSGAPIKEASGADVKRAKKSFKKRYIVIPVCVVLVIILAVGAILGGVFGFAASSAKKNMTLTKDECKQYAITYVVEHQNDLFADLSQGTFKAGQLWIEDLDRQFHYNDRNLGASYYSYVVEVKGQLLANGRQPIEIEVELRINTATRSVDVLDRDIDRD